MASKCQPHNFQFWCNAHLSPNFTQRSRLFLCIETNISLKLTSSIALAVLSVNSGQSFSAMSISVKLIIPVKSWQGIHDHAFQAHISFGGIFGIKDFWKINILKSDFSIFPGFVPLIFCVIQFPTFLNYLSIKFGECNYQRNYG